ncbi:MAG: PilZ domain-containing protein, partial [Myxococcota bacterium]|nr:PilZ domain-containing protein [Myxococcota bacterium]
MTAGATARRRPARRRFPRITTRVLVDYVADGRLRRDYATTLGAGGLFVATNEPLRSGETTRVRFRVPKTERLVEVDARVVWSHGEQDAGSGSTGMGLTFT